MSSFQRFSFIVVAFLAVFAGGAPAHAVVKLLSFSSGFKTVENPDPLTVNIFTGNTFNTCTSADGVSTCDSCASLSSVPLKNFNQSGTALKGIACNNQQIYPTLKFQVVLSSDQTTSYPASCAKVVTATIAGVAYPPERISTYTALAANQEITATWSWSTLCGAGKSGNAACNLSFTGGFKIGFDAACEGKVTEGVNFQIAMRYIGNSPPQHFGCPEANLGAFEGFCDFNIYPGDKKVFLYDKPQPPGANVASAFAAGNQTSTTKGYATASDESSMKIAFLRLYYVPGNDFSNLTPASLSHDFATDSTASIKDRRITGLDNGQQYVFASASVDQGGNVEYFMDPDYNGAGENSVTPSASDATAVIGTTQSATPAEVFGLLDNKNCFIATAAYGSGDAGDVQTLRDFRNRYLITWAGGRKFVRAYYQIAPPIANFISDREWLKEMVRGTLKPVVLVAELAFRYGLIALIVLMSLAGAIFYSAIRMLQRGRPK